MIHGRGFIRGMGCGGWVHCRDCGGACSQDDGGERPDSLSEQLWGAVTPLHSYGHGAVASWVVWTLANSRWSQVTPQPERPSAEQVAAALERLRTYARTERAVAWIRATYDKEG